MVFRDELVGKELADWLHRRCCSQCFGVQVETSDWWCDLAVSSETGVV